MAGRVVLPTTIAQAASAAGFRGQDLVNMVAIALAESSGNTEAVNRTSGALGLWQINPKAHPWITGMDWKDPKVNAQAAFRVYSEAPNPGKITRNKWSVYPLQSTAYMPVAIPAVASIAGLSLAAGPISAGTEAGINVATGAQSPLEAVNGLVDRIGDQSLWLRIAKVGLGVGLVVVGVAVVARPVIQPLASTAATVATKGVVK